MYQQAARSLVTVSWRAVVIAGNTQTIYARAVQIGKNSMTLLALQALPPPPHMPVRVLLEVPNRQNPDKQYLDCNGQCTHAVLVAAGGEYRTGFRIERINSEHRSIINSFLKQKF